MELGPSVLEEEAFLIALQDMGKSIEEIEKALELKESLLQIAVQNGFQQVIQSLIQRGDYPFNRANVVGETIAHHIFESGEKEALCLLRKWVENNNVNITMQTATKSNPFHYAVHITDPALLEIYFSMATQELLTAQNQLGLSPLSSAIAHDNAAFLAKAIETFPQLIELTMRRTDLVMQCHWLLHEIARTDAQQCFSLLKSKFDDYLWTRLNQHRIEEQLPEDVAALNGNRELYQTFKDYRSSNGFPRMSWLTALEVARGHDKAWHLQSIVDDAKEELVYQAAVTHWYNQKEEEEEEEEQDEEEDAYERDIKSKRSDSNAPNLSPRFR